uniref:response regulator n=1 Tax=Cupriavidus ulmosensis TaxID=3065913 RepID=UPI003F84562C
MATILIVDDHPALRLVVKTQLSQVLGVSNILEADNGQAAIEAAKQFEPDLAILDLDIPPISGLDVIPRLKLIYPPIRILVISGQDVTVSGTRLASRGRR